MDLSEVKAVALEAARAAAAIHQRHAGRVLPHEWTEKGSSDFVSHVDREAEACIVEHIQKAFPGHAIMAEEAAADQTGTDWSANEWLWLVDPLDGTTNFLHGYPMYAASVAAARRGVVMAGAVVCAPTAEEWCAVRGGGATLNGRPIRVSTIDRLPASLIGTGFPFKLLELMPAYLGQFDRVMRNTSGVRRAGSAALDLCHVATGYFDGFWELELRPWSDLLAGNPSIHGQLGALLAAAE